MRPQERITRKGLRKAKHSDHFKGMEPRAMSTDAIVKEAVVISLDTARLQRQMKRALAGAPYAFGSYNPNAGQSR